MSGIKHYYMPTMVPNRYHTEHALVVGGWWRWVAVVALWPVFGKPVRDTTPGGRPAFRWIVDDLDYYGGV